MLRSSRYAPELGEVHPKTSLTAQSPPSSAVRGKTVTALLAVFDAWREALVAHRRYEHLRSRGIAHDKAIREALCIGPKPVRATRDAARALCFSGKA